MEQGPERTKQAKKDIVSFYGLYQVYVHDACRAGQ